MGPLTPALIHQWDESSMLTRHGFGVGNGWWVQVNSFVNHRVDVHLMDLCGRALAERFRDTAPTLVFTAQTSGR